MANEVEWSVAVLKEVYFGDTSLPTLSKDAPGSGKRHVITAFNASFSSNNSLSPNNLPIALRDGSTPVWYGVVRAGELNVQERRIGIAENASVDLLFLHAAIPQGYDGKYTVSLSMSGYTETMA